MGSLRALDSNRTECRLIVHETLSFTHARERNRRRLSSLRAQLEAAHLEQSGRRFGNDHR
jgi:hypothetical protein